MTEQEKAQIVLDDRDADGTRWFVLVMEVSARTGINPNAVWELIKAIANGVDEYA